MSIGRVSDVVTAETERQVETYVHYMSFFVCLCVCECVKVDRYTHTLHMSFCFCVSVWMEDGGPGLFEGLGGE